jgi:hypothetical protein
MIANGTGAFAEPYISKVKQEIRAQKDGGGYYELGSIFRSIQLGVAPDYNTFEVWNGN